MKSIKIYIILGIVLIAVGTADYFYVQKLKNYADTYNDPSIIDNSKEDKKGNKNSSDSKSNNNDNNPSSNEELSSESSNNSNTELNKNEVTNNEIEEEPSDYRGTSNNGGSNSNGNSNGKGSNNGGGSSSGSGSGSNRPTPSNPTPIIIEEETVTQEEEEEEEVEPTRPNPDTNNRCIASTPRELCGSKTYTQVINEGGQNLYIPVRIRFLNTQLTDSKEYKTNEAIIIKTKQNKIIVVDLGSSSSVIYEEIKSQLKDITGKENPTIDYLVISHSHSDHMGNISTIIKDSSITINKIIYKNTVDDKMRKKIKLAGYDMNNAINTDYYNYSTGSLSFIVDDYVTMTLFNIKDVFAGNNNCYDSNGNDRIGSIRKYSSSLLDSNGNVKEKFSRNGLRYLSTLNFNNSLIDVDKPVKNNNYLECTAGYPTNYYYEYTVDDRAYCNQNANSIAVLLSIKVDDGNKYIYIPSDLENNGYSFFGELQRNGEKIYGTGTTYFGSSSVKIPSETNVAKRVKEYITSHGDTLSDIIIYQASHHNYNNAKDAVDILGINNTGRSSNPVCSIATSRTTGELSSDALTARSYHYTLSNTKVLATGCNNCDKRGIYCYVISTGDYYCKAYQ